jgi:plasmid replication initiation protein
MVYSGDRVQIQETLPENKIIQLATKTLLPDRSDNHSCLKRALKSLTEKSIFLQGKDEKGAYEINTHLVQKTRYYLNNEMVEIELDRDLLPSFLALAKNYSKYLLEVAFNASSSNVMKLYQYISHWKDKPKKEIMIDELKDWLQLGDKYPHPKNFRVCVLEPASKELKEKADVFFTIHSPIKLGRRITGWNINIYRKTISDEEKIKSSAFEETIRNFLKVHFKLKDKDIDQFNAFLSKPELHRHIWDALHRVAKRIDNGKEPIKSRRAYTISTLKNEFEKL